MRGRERAIGDRLQQLAGFGQRAGIGVDDHTRTRHCGVVRFPHVGPKAAHQVEVRAGTQPFAAHQRLARRGGAGNHVGALHGSLQIPRHHRIDTFAAQPPRQRRCRRAVARPNLHLAQAGMQSQVRARHPRRQPPRTHQQQALGIRARQLPRGQGRGGRRAAQRERFAVNQRQRHAGGAIEQQVAGLHSARAQCRSPRHHGDRLHPDRPWRPGRHQQQAAGRRGGNVHRAQGVRMAQRRRGVAASKGRLERRGERQPRQSGMHLGG